MYTAEQQELDAQSDTSMTSLTYEDGLEEIDSFFESPPDDRSSNVGVQSGRPHSGSKDASGRVDAEPSAPSSTQPQQFSQPIDGEDEAEETREDHDGDEFATLIEDLDQVTESATSAAETNPKARLDFILNNAATSPLQPSHKPALDQPERETVLPDRTEAQGSMTAEAGVNAAPELAEPSIASTMPRTTQAGEEQTHTAPGSPTESATPSPPDFSEGTLAGLIAENLAPDSSRRTQTKHLSVSLTLGLEQQDAQQGSPFQPSIALDEEQMPVATPAHKQNMECAIPDTAAVLEKSPDMPSSEGKHSLMEEMRNEEEAAGGVIASKAEQIDQPNLAPAAQSDQITEAEAELNNGEALTLDQAAASQQILDEASRAQVKAKAIVSRSRLQEAQLAAGKDRSVGGETEDEAVEGEISKQDQATEINTIEKSRKEINATQHPAKAVVSRTRSQAKQASYREVSSDNAETEDEGNGDEAGTKDEAAVNEPNDMAQKKGAGPESSRPATIDLYPVKPTTAKQPAQPTKPAKKPAKKKGGPKPKKAAKKATTPASDEPQKPVLQQRASSRPRLSTVYEDAKSVGAVDEEQNEPAPSKPTLPAKRKPTNDELPPAKRLKQAVTSKRLRSEDNDGALQSGETDTPLAVPQRRSKIRNHMGGREMKELAYGFYANPTASGPRQTRGQKHEEKAKVPNPGQAAKARHKKG